MLLLNINYEQKTIFIIVACWHQDLPSYSSHTGISSQLEQICSVCCSKQLQETLFARKVLI